MTAQYQLVMHSGPTPGKVFPMDGDVITIGREAENGIVINDAEVSRKHTQFVFQGGKYIITDLGSTNGTFVNGERLTGQHVLVPGEVISLGEQINLLFESVSNVDPNATVLSAGRPPMPAPMPRPVTPPPVAASRPISQPPFAGQMPAGPAPLPASAAPAKSGNSRIGLIVGIVVVLCLICSCAGLLYYIDSNALWCKFLPFLFSGGCGG
jgi:pSer/pThr/pTyr-binding forkhead associated (FHA) protein